MDDSSSRLDTAEMIDTIVLKPYNHLNQGTEDSPMRPLLKGLNLWLHVPEHTLATIEKILEMSFDVSILVDDIQDDSPLRRGMPPAHKIYGLPRTVNVVTFVFFVALQKLAELAKGEQDDDDDDSGGACKVERAVLIFTGLGTDIHRGQAEELHSRDNFVCPSEAEYRKMLDKKTGSVFRMMARLMYLFSSNNDSRKKPSQQDLVDLASILGIYFQVRNDYGNFWLQKDVESKGFADDLSEGKFSFPIIHAIRETESGAEVSRILRQRTTDMGVKRYCVSLLESAGSLEYTRFALREFDSQARKEIERLGGNAALVAYLDEQRDWDQE